MRNLLILLALTFSAPFPFSARFNHLQSTAPRAPGKPPTQPGASAPPAIVEAASRIQPPPANHRFPNGVTYVYSAEWRLFNAGTGTIHIEAAGGEERVTATADAIGAVALLYHVHDRLEAAVDPRTFCSLSLIKHTEEGFRRIETTIHYDYQKRKSVLDEKNLRNNTTKHTENDIPECVTDVISALYYSASLPLEPGRQFTFPLNDGGKTADVNVRVEAREEVKVPSGTYKTLRLQTEASSGALKGKGKIWVWYSDDANRIPVQMRARMFWGTLTFKLQHIDQSSK